MRYTEAAIEIQRNLLRELGQVQPIGSELDGTLKEPKVLPARLPHICLMGLPGLRLAWQPTFRLTMCASWLTPVRLCSTTVRQSSTIFWSMFRPDYPTEAEIITPKADIRKIYESGKGSIKMRAVYHSDNGDIVITALPHQSSEKQSTGTDRRPNAGEKAADGE